MFCDVITTCIPYPFLVDDDVCFQTKGRGRVFIPINVLNELAEGKNKTARSLEVRAAPGLPQIPEEIVSSISDDSRADALTNFIKLHHWYWKHLIEAMKPVAVNVPERYAKIYYNFML